ncbi:MAG: glyoxalase [Acidobacteria bacterium]|jgi:predicted enzyme related to lactoylglutathione lyase|nr:MAG: glyoxalase [Acidobacteriota bacterium]
MKRVTGIGGIFFQSSHPQQLFAWYEKHLGIQRSPETPADATFCSFEWLSGENPETKGRTVWALFPRDTEYFKQSTSPFMINYRVDDLDALLQELQKEGVQIDPHREDYEYGRFAWIFDPEGNRIELWEPK